MGRSTPSWIKRGSEPPKAAVPPAIAALVHRQCVQEGGSAVTARSSALHSKDAPICSRLIGSCERYVHASLALDFVLIRSK